MPIISIVSQPATDSVFASYRPIVFILTAKATDDTPKPPVVYCDIYIGNVFYKTMQKTQYLELQTLTTSWLFDIQDACQEIIGKYLGENGGINIVNVTELIKTVYCKFRSSGIDSNGFIQYEDTAPIQATSESAAISGTGTQSNTFFVVNATLKHESNQNLLTHLSYFKLGTWDANTYPLTHRNTYSICNNNTDYFGILSLLQPTCIKIVYRLKNTLDFKTTSCKGVVTGGGGGGGCIPVGIVTDVLPNGTAAVEYDQYIQLVGTAPFTITDIIKPFWMTTVAVVGSTVHINGTPANDEAGNYSLSFTVHNCTSDIAEFAAGFTIVAVGATIGVCVAAHDETIGSRIFIGVNSTEVVTVNTLCHCIIHTSWDGGTGFTDYPFDRTLRAGYTSSVHAKLLYDGIHVDEIFIGAEITSFVPATQAGKTFTYIGLCS